MLRRREALALVPGAFALAACEALGIKAKIVTATTMNGKTTVREREAKNWDEFEEAMGEVATDFSAFAQAVGDTTAELVKRLTEVPPPGQVRLGQLAPGLASFEGDVRYDYLKVAAMKPEPEYDFKYVQLGVPNFDAFFRSSAEMYATAYQLIETGRHIGVAAAAARGEAPDRGLESGDRRLPRAQVESALSEFGGNATGKAATAAERYQALWEGVLPLGVKLASKASETTQTGIALVASAPSALTNPKLLLHLDLIVKGLEQSVALVKDTGGLLTELVS
jgi:hypothetical protein